MRTHDHVVRRGNFWISWHPRTQNRPAFVGSLIQTHTTTQQRHLRELWALSRISMTTLRHSCFVISHSTMRRGFRWVAEDCDLKSQSSDWRLAYSICSGIDTSLCCCSQAPVLHCCWHFLGSCQACRLWAAESHCSFLSFATRIQSGLLFWPGPRCPCALAAWHCTSVDLLESQLYPVLRFRWRQCQHITRFLMVCLGLIVLDVGLDLAGLWGNTFFSRSLTGALFGGACGLLVSFAIQNSS